MATNLSIESPDFDEIRKRAGTATEDAIKLLWGVLNVEIETRRTSVRQAKEVDEGKVFTLAPTTNQHNLDTKRSTIVLFNGSSAINLTGIVNGVEGQRLTLHNLGSATITIVHNSGSSFAANRIITDTAANKSLTAGSSMILLYLTDLWRELNLL